MPPTAASEKERSEQEVQEVTQSDYFQQLKQRVQSLRARRE